MADQADVETALVGLVTAALYPQGAAAPSVLGVLARVYRGWPNAAMLDSDLAAGVVNITVFPEPGHERNTTRWAEDYQIPSPVAPQLAVDVSGQTVVFSGAAVSGQIAGVLVDGLAVVHRTTGSDTPASVAAVLATAIRTQRIATLSGASLTIPGAALVVGRVVADQPAVLATRRQSQRFRISCWCAGPQSRDAAASAIDAALSSQDFMALSDGLAGRLRFAEAVAIDRSEDAALYRRDLLYEVEYATTVTALLPEMIFGQATTSPGSGGVVLSRLE